MLYITLPDSLKKTVAANRKDTITGDETLAFTEQPDEESDNEGRDHRIVAHDLFELFTANIIKQNTDFVR